MDFKLTFVLVFDFFFATVALVALALGDVDLLPSVVLDFSVAAVALPGFAVVIALRVELFVLRGAPCGPRSVFLWFESPADVFAAPSASLTAFLASGSSDRNALLREWPLEGVVEVVLLVWSDL